LRHITQMSTSVVFRLVYSSQPEFIRGSSEKGWVLNYGRGVADKKRISLLLRFAGDILFC